MISAVPAAAAEIYEVLYAWSVRLDGDSGLLTSSLEEDRRLDATLAQVRAHRAVPAADLVNGLGVVHLHLLGPSADFSTSEQWENARALLGALNSTRSVSGLAQALGAPFQKRVPGAAHRQHKWRDRVRASFDRAQDHVGLPPTSAAPPRLATASRRLHGPASSGPFLAPDRTAMRAEAPRRGSPRPA